MLPSHASRGTSSRFRHGNMVASCFCIRMAHERASSFWLRTEPSIERSASRRVACGPAPPHGESLGEQSLSRKNQPDAGGVRNSGYASSRIAASSSLRPYNLAILLLKGMAITPALRDPHRCRSGGNQRSIDVKPSAVAYSNWHFHGCFVVSAHGLFVVSWFAVLQYGSFFHSSVRCCSTMASGMRLTLTFLPSDSVTSHRPAARTVTSHRPAARTCSLDVPS